MQCMPMHGYIRSSRACRTCMGREREYVLVVLVGPPLGTVSRSRLYVYGDVKLSRPRVYVGRSLTVQ